MPRSTTPDDPGVLKPLPGGLTTDLAPRKGWRHLLADPAVRLWYDNLSGGSPITAVENTRVLNRYLAAHRLTPGELLAMAKKDRRAVEDQLQDFMRRLEAEGKAPGYILNHSKAVRSYLDFHEVRLLRKFKVRHADATPTLDDERVPTKEELKSILSSATTRGRVVVSFMAFSGVRPEVLGDFAGSDGLRMRDLPELQIVDGRVAFAKLPTAVVVRAELSKAGHRYLTFLPSEGCTYLQSYLEERLSRGETLGPDSPVIGPTPGFEDSGWRKKVAGRAFIVTKNVTADVRRAMRPRFPWRPYVLRAYFDTQMLLAESNGKVTRAFRAYWMGHKGDMDARYTTNKGRLPEPLVEEMRRAFRESEAVLTTTGEQVADAREMLLRTWREQARAYGIDPVKVRIEKERSGARLGAEDEIRLLTAEIAKRVAPHAMPAGTSFVNGEGRKNKVLRGRRQLVRYLDDGWELVSNLGSGTYLVQRSP